MAGLVEQRGRPIEIVTHDLDRRDRHDRAGGPEADAGAQDRGAGALVLIDEDARHRLFARSRTGVMLATAKLSRCERAARSTGLVRELTASPMKSSVISTCCNGAGNAARRRRRSPSAPGFCRVCRTRSAVPHRPSPPVPRPRREAAGAAAAPSPALDGVPSLDRRELLGVAEGPRRRQPMGDLALEVVHFRLPSEPSDGVPHRRPRERPVIETPGVPRTAFSTLATPVPATLAA